MKLEVSLIAKEEPQELLICQCDDPLTECQPQDVVPRVELMHSNRLEWMIPTTEMWIILHTPDSNR